MQASKLKDIHAELKPKSGIKRLVDYVHRYGPDSTQLLEQLSLYKEFSPGDFADAEENIISSMGLFYKIGLPETVYSLVMQSLGRANTTSTGDILTPVQASVRNAIAENQYVSISAPTSAGKSYAIRDYVMREAGDVAVIVPSRALIAEYIASLKVQFEFERQVMVMPFVDDVFKSRVKRRVFVLTPERARDLFASATRGDIKLFFFDEAHMSEEEGRGVVFDAVVRRVMKKYPSAKLIFAHPFVDNPSAQFDKHGIEPAKSYSNAYSQGAVGKVFVHQHRGNGKDYYFSPFEEKGHLLSNSVPYRGSFAEFALDPRRTVLVYVSKSSIYNGKYLACFRSILDGFQPIEDPEALEIIEEVRQLIGADKDRQRSSMVDLMSRGVVIHHGSVPLEVRFLIERFIRAKCARICFATSTLAQGINMPFDVVWLESMRLSDSTSEKKSLSFKNLIGRAGRLSSEKKFDYGYVYTKSPELLSKRLNEGYMLSSVSILDEEESAIPVDDWEIVSSIRDETYDDELRLPESRKSRLLTDDALAAMASVLDTVYPHGSEGFGHLRGVSGARAREDLRTDLRIIYEIYLDRRMKNGEAAVFHEAISVLSQVMAGRTFKEIAGTRFARISRRDDRQNMSAQFSQMAATLPDSSMEIPFPVFKGPKEQLPYDTVVFDTYDYLDKVISFCLVDTFSAAAQLYLRESNDERALRLVELLKYGTNDPVSIMLLRYGFAPELVDEVKRYVKHVDEAGIVFVPEVASARRIIAEAVAWYL